MQYRRKKQKKNSCENSKNVWENSKLLHTHISKFMNIIFWFKNLQIKH
jgi:hypothetical protein